MPVDATPVPVADLCSALEQGPTPGEAPPAAQRHDPAGCWRELGILAVATVLALSSWFTAASLLPQLKDVFGVSDERISLLTVAVNSGFMLGAVASSIALLPDRYNPRWLFLLGSTAASLANAGLLLVGAAARPSLTVAFALRFLNGMAYALVYPCAMKIASQWFVRGRGVAFGVVLGALTVGSALPSWWSAVFPWSICPPAPTEGPDMT